MHTFEVEYLVICDNKYMGNEIAEYRSGLPFDLNSAHSFLEKKHKKKSINHLIIHITDVKKTS